MAWRSSGNSNAALINNLATNGMIKNERVKAAMLSVDRSHYAPVMPYQDSPQGIGYGATISAPHMHAHACDYLSAFIKPGSRVLDVGSGSGYLTHVLAELVKPDGRVIGVDHIQGLVDLARANMAKSAEGRSFMESGVAKFVKADGRLGLPEEAPFDAIHVGAAAAVHHQALEEQLKRPGRLFVPVGDKLEQFIFVVDKKADGSVTKEKLFGVRYVPLTDAPKQ